MMRIPVRLSAIWLCFPSIVICEKVGPGSGGMILLRAA
jgi:hypothetical protein